MIEYSRIIASIKGPSNTTPFINDTNIENSATSTNNNSIITLTPTNGSTLLTGVAKLMESLQVQ